MSHANTSSEYPGNIVSPQITRNSTNSNQEDLFNSDHHEPSTQTTNHGVEEGDNIFPSQYECPITHEPPAVGATFMNHPQMFEYSAIFRHIATLGRLSAVRNVFHPTTCDSVPRTEALNQVNYCTPEVQSIITAERRLRGLSENDQNPITTNERTLYETTMRKLQQR